jgi:hypothetical protein
VLQFFFARQIELVFTGVDVCIFGQGDFYQRLVFLFAQHDTNGGGFGIGFDGAVKVVDVHLHLAQVLVRGFDLVEAAFIRFLMPSRKT